MRLKTRLPMSNNERDALLAKYRKSHHWPHDRGRGETTCTKDEIGDTRYGLCKAYDRLIKGKK